MHDTRPRTQSLNTHIRDHLWILTMLQSVNFSIIDKNRNTAELSTKGRTRKVDNGYSTISEMGKEDFLGQKHFGLRSHLAYRFLSYLAKVSAAKPTPAAPTTATPSATSNWGRQPIKPRKHPQYRPTSQIDSPRPVVLVHRVLDMWGSSKL